MVERVSLPLTRLIYDYIKNRKDIDKTFIDKIIEIVVNNLSLNDYVKGLKINNKPYDGSKRLLAADYNFVDRIITVELQATLEFLQTDSKDLRLSPNELFAIIYDRIVGLILHELEHANQVKKEDSKDNSLENKIIKYSNRDMALIRNDAWFDKLVEDGLPESLIYTYLAEKKSRYYKYYKYAPIERLAEYYSHKTMATIFKEIGSMPNISYYECLKLCTNYLRGYREGIVPTKYYLDKTATYYSWEELEREGRNLDFETRASLGLPISDDEYEYLSDTTVSLRELVLK